MKRGFYLLMAMSMVEYDDKIVTPADMKRVIDAAGYELIIDEETRVDALEKNNYRLLFRRMSISWLFSMLTMAVSAHQPLRHHSPHVLVAAQVP